MDGLMTKAEIYAMAVAQIHIGIAMARVKGVVCGSPRDIRVVEVKSNG